MVKHLLICALLLAGARPLSAQQIDPSKRPRLRRPMRPAAAPVDTSAPPPPPPAAAPTAQPIDPSTPPPPPSTDAPDAFASLRTCLRPAARRAQHGRWHVLSEGWKYRRGDRTIRGSGPLRALAGKTLESSGRGVRKERRILQRHRSYKKYLEILPTAEDAKKIQKRISLLEEKIGKESSKAAAR